MIRRYSLGLDKIPLRFAAATMFVVGCSATAEDPTTPNGGTGPGPAGGTGVGGMGGSIPLAGQPAQFGGSGNMAGKPSGGSAGKMGAAGTGAGGTPGAAGSVGTAGAAPIAGAAAVAGAPAGGTGGAATCDNYSGTLKTPSTIFKAGYGRSTTGMWQGYAYTFKFGTAVVTPGQSTTMACFPGMQLCAAGSIPADDASGAGIGWSISQMMAGTPAAVALTTPVTFKFTGGAVGMRVGLVPETGTMEFCYTLTAADVTAAVGAGLTLPLADFKQECYDTAKATPYAGSMVKAIQVSVPGSASGAKTFDFCLVDIEPG